MKSHLQDVERFKALDQLITLTPPDRLSKHIGVLLLGYLQYKADDLPEDLTLIVEDVTNLFEMLDKVEIQ